MLHSCSHLGLLVVAIRLGYTNSSVAGSRCHLILVLLYCYFDVIVLLIVLHQNVSCDHLVAIGGASMLIHVLHCGRNCMFMFTRVLLLLESGGQGFSVSVFQGTFDRSERQKSAISGHHLHWLFEFLSSGVFVFSPRFSVQFGKGSLTPEK